MPRPPPRSTLFPYTTLFRSTVRVTAPNGTDFTCNIPQNAHMHRNTGEATREKVRILRNVRSEEHTSELQSLRHLVCRLLLEKKKNRHAIRDVEMRKTIFIRC